MLYTLIMSIRFYNLKEKLLSSIAVASFVQKKFQFLKQERCKVNSIAMGGKLLKKSNQKE